MIGTVIAWLMRQGLIAEFTYFHEAHDAMCMMRREEPTGRWEMHFHRARRTYFLLRWKEDVTGQGPITTYYV